MNKKIASNKFLAMKKKLIQRASLLGIGCIGLGACAYILMGYENDFLDEKQILLSRNMAIMGENSAIQQQLGTGYEVNSYYESYARYRNADFSLNREAAAKLLSQLRNEHFISGMEMTIAPVSDASTKIALSTGTLVKSEIALKFSALSDQAFFEFLEALQSKIPGILVVKEMMLARERDVASDVLIGLSENKITPLIKGEISFVWIGIKLKPTDAASARTNPGGPSAP